MSATIAKTHTTTLTTKKSSASAKTNNAATEKLIDGLYLLQIEEHWDCGVEELEKLIAKGADVNAVDKYGWTALMTAAVRNSSEQVEVLLRHGADPNILDRSGQDALYLAMRELSVCEHAYNASFFVSILRHLLKAGANPRRKSAKGDSAIEMMRDYLSHGVLPDGHVLKYLDMACRDVYDMMTRYPRT